MFGDLMPDAPELAVRETYSVGVRSLMLVHTAQWDVLHAKNGETPRYNRPLPVEIWSPANIPAAVNSLHIAFACDESILRAKSCGCSVNEINNMVAAGYGNPKAEF
ncbi:hypothetical protein [Fibrella aquatilis]|uniref:Uncharacterized protein n=1 Tax=Fibrella aquatilis TaxID=2817059 RepID=A0A939K236_9BACT|nr:hypothetical protein [Fibrella aquatilis]MBO0934148.1 hypothetical protein [Fibrella aquatilis]